MKIFGYQDGSLGMISVCLGSEYDLQILTSALRYYGPEDLIPLTKVKYNGDRESCPLLTALRLNSLEKVEIVLPVNIFNLQNHETCDITLSLGNIDNVMIKVHQLVLVAISPVFRSMFLSNMRESQTNHIIFRNMTPLTLGAFVHFIYTGYIVPHYAELDVGEIKNIARMYMIPNFLEILLFARRDLDEI